MIIRQPFEPDPGEVSFRLMSNVMDLASAAGNCAHAVESETGFRTEDTHEAWRFFQGVKSWPGVLLDRAEAPYRTDLMSREHWRSFHARTLEQARRVRDRLGEMRATCRGEPAEHFERLSLRIADGERLAAA